MPGNEERPGVGTEATPERLTTCPETTDEGVTMSRLVELAELDVLAERVAGCFVVVVARPSDADPDRIVRRPYLTAKAAERAAHRALARGQNAVVYLAELRPVHRLVGGGRW